MPPKKSASSRGSTASAAKGRSSSSSLGKGGTKPTVRSASASSNSAATSGNKKGSEGISAGTGRASLGRSASGTSLGDIDLNELAADPAVPISKEDIEAVKGRPDLNISDPDFDAYWEVVKQKMGLPKVKPIHSSGYNRIQHMLRVFDLDPNYGPTVGMTRLQRWHRAKALGEDPPEAIRTILESKQGMLLYKDNVFVGTGI